MVAAGDHSDSLMIIGYEQKQGWRTTDVFTTLVLFTVDKALSEPL